VELLKVHKAYPLFRELIVLHAVKNLLQQAAGLSIHSFPALQAYLKQCKRGPWHNVGGQLVKHDDLEDLKQRIRKGKIGSWPQLHDAYRTLGEKYDEDKLQHALACLLHLHQLSAKDLTAAQFKKFLDQSVYTFGSITEGIYHSREKDYLNPFRQMTYENEEEMEAVVGRLEDNSFIQQTIAQLKTYKKQVKDLIKKWEL
jgi:hypothetical protein